LELQYTFLPLKCYEQRSVPQFFYFSIVSFWDPHLGSLRDLATCHKWFLIIKSARLSRNFYCSTSSFLKGFLEVKKSEMDESKKQQHEGKK
jgi:hypothetical protein